MGSLTDTCVYSIRDKATRFRPLNKVKFAGPLTCLAAALGLLACLAAALGPIACLSAALGPLACLAAERSAP